jgi:hypothetical protein
VTSPVTSGNTMQICWSHCGNHTQETARRRAAYTAFVNSSYWQIDHPLALCPSPSPFCPDSQHLHALRSRHLSSRCFSPAAWGRPCLQFRNSLTYSPALRGIRRSSALHHAGVVVPISPEPLRPCCSFAMPVCIMVQVQIGL